MGRNIMDNLVRVADVRSVTGIAEYGMFYAPDNIEYIHDWIARHPADEQTHLWTAIAMLVNFQNMQLLQLAQSSSWAVRFDRGEKSHVVAVAGADEGLRLVRLINACRTLAIETGWSIERVADEHQLAEDEFKAFQLFTDGVSIALLHNGSDVAEIDPDVIAWEFVDDATGAA